MFNERAVVRNLDVSNVTWANTYINAAKKNGIQITGDQGLPVDRIFIGDQIQTADISDKQKHIYFLGASSVPLSDSISQNEIDTEFFNMDWANLVLLVSNAEKSKILSRRSDLDNKIQVNGFPIDIDGLMTIKKTAKYPCSIVFLGQTRKIKNVDFEIELINRLKKHGFAVYHLSSREISQKKYLEQAGCVVVEGVESKRYWKLLSKFQFFASTSFYESLCVSGIEASVLGCVPIVPNHSGFTDWCPSKLRYEPFDSNNVMDIIDKNKGLDSFSIDLSWYSSRKYFSRINFLPK